MLSGRVTVAIGTKRTSTGRDKMLTQRALLGLKRVRLRPLLLNGAVPVGRGISTTWKRPIGGVRAARR